MKDKTVVKRAFWAQIAKHNSHVLNVPNLGFSRRSSDAVTRFITAFHMDFTFGVLKVIFQSL